MLKKNLFFIIFFLITFKVNAEQSYAIVDIDFLVNNSKAGKFIQTKIKSHNEKIINEFRIIEKKLKEEEKKLVSQKNILSEEDFKKKTRELNKKILSYTEERKKEIDKSNKKKSDALIKLIANINKIIAEYAEEKKISLLLDKKNIIMAENKNDITDEIFEILNNKISKIKMN
tara:strand:+ start:160 stop:678 length:519 start_codon:yes stop_codon:yes gene_type:complete